MLIDIHRVFRVRDHADDPLNEDRRLSASCCRRDKEIPDISPDGIYGPATAEAVRKFQSIFGLPQTGVVDFATWYKISHIYVGITRIAELS